jgi:uncharacterized OsmC-like protein
MTKINNVDVDNLQAFEALLRKDPSASRKTQVIEGEWIVEEGNVQFQSTVRFEGGETVLRVDNPTFMGGGGHQPGPMHYCFFGLASCYTGTFARMAAMVGIELKKLTVRVEAAVNFSQVFGLSDDPTMEEVRVKLHAVSDAPQDQIKQAEELALQRWPVVYTLRNPVRLVPEITISHS